MPQFYATIADMIATLDDRHSRYLSPQDAFEEQAIRSGGAYVGIGTLQSGNVVLGVLRDSPAAQAGLRRRDHLLLVDGLPYGSDGASLDGPEGSTVTLQVQTPGEAPRTVVVPRRSIVSKLE